MGGRDRGRLAPGGEPGARGHRSGRMDPQPRAYRDELVSAPGDHGLDPGGFEIAGIVSVRMLPAGKHRGSHIELIPLERE